MQQVWPLFPVTSIVTEFSITKKKTTNPALLGPGSMSRARLPQLTSVQGDECIKTRQKQGRIGMATAPTAAADHHPQGPVEFQLQDDWV